MTTTTVAQNLSSYYQPSDRLVDQVDRQWASLLAQFRQAGQDGDVEWARTLWTHLRAEAGENPARLEEARRARLEVYAALTRRTAGHQRGGPVPVGQRPCGAKRKDTDMAVNGIPTKEQVEAAEPLDFDNVGYPEGAVIPILMNGYRVELHTKGLATLRLLNSELDRLEKITQVLAQRGIEPATGVFDVVATQPAQPAAPARRWGQGGGQDPLDHLVGTQAYIHPTEGLPCCPKHKGRDGQPRTMKEGKGGAFCTAKDDAHPSGYCPWKVDANGILSRKR